MRIGLIASCFLLFAPFFAVAQRDAPPVGHRFGGGALAGVNFSQVDGDNNGGYKALNGIGGLWLSRQLGSSGWGLRMELRYVGKGSRSVGFLDGGQGVKATRYAFALHYLELPVYAEYTFGAKLAANIGLGAGYLLAWKERNAYGEYDKATRLAPKPFELSAHVALAWHFHRHFALRGGFSYSILPIRGIPDKPMGRRSGQYNNMLYLLLAYEI